MDAVAAGGAAIGIYVSESEKNIVKPLVRCIADRKPVLGCIKDTIVQQLPPESRDLVKCLTDGKDAAQCAQNEAIKRLPPQSQELAKCIATGDDVVACGQKFAVSQAEKAAFGVVDKLKSSAKDKFKEASGPIQNIIEVADGIARGDWEKVLTSGGKAVAIYVVNTTISTLLTPATAYISGPIINTIVANRIDLVADLIKALKDKDIPALARIVTEAYLTAAGEIPCALLPEGAVKEAICGTLGKIIQEVGKGVGSITGAVLDVVTSVLDDLGLTDLFNDILSGIGGLFSGKDDDCGSPQQYYANNFPVCFNRASFLRTTNPSEYDKFEGSVYTGCRQHFIRCFKSDTVTRICDPLRDLFRTQTQTLNQALKDSAGAFVRSRKGLLEANRARVCSPYYYQGEVDNFVNSCENSLKATFPLTGDATAANCRPDPKRCEGMFSCSTPTAWQASCRQAAEGNLKRITAEVCAGAGQCFAVEAAPPEPVVR